LNESSGPFAAGVEMCDNRKIPEGGFMSQIMDIIIRSLGGNVLSQMARKLGIPEELAGKALGAILPALIGGLARNASQEDGARSLDQALGKDHDGSILGDLGGFINGFQGGPGEAILGHILGNRQSVMSQQIGQGTGLNPQAVQSLMAMAAPLVMGALGKERQQQSLDAGGLATLLQEERFGLSERTPQSVGMLESLLGEGSGRVDSGGLSAGMDAISGLLRGAAPAPAPPRSGSMVEFVRDAGHPVAAPAGPSDRNSPQFRDMRTGNALKKAINDLGIGVQGFDLLFRDGTAVVTGRVASQADREKIILAAGNVAGVARVEDRLTVEQKETPSVMYTVKAGDTLSKIAKAQYGDASKYPAIFEANKPMLKDPNKIFVGQVLRVPPKA
jgi:hypothetical protein